MLIFQGVNHINLLFETSLLVWIFIHLGLHQFLFLGCGVFRVFPQQLYVWPTNQPTTVDQLSWRSNFFGLPHLGSVWSFFPLFNFAEEEDEKAWIQKIDAPWWEMHRCNARFRCWENTLHVEPHLHEITTSSHVFSSDERHQHSYNYGSKWLGILESKYMA